MKGFSSGPVGHALVKLWVVLAYQHPPCVSTNMSPVLVFSRVAHMSSFRANIASTVKPAHL
jgi:hypothetical protein